MWQQGSYLSAFKSLAFAQIPNNLSYIDNNLRAKKMTNRKAFLFIQLLVIGLFLTIANSCEKEADPIVKEDPVISWESPSDIISGTDVELAFR